jgi:hypothetical protein
MWLLLFRSGRTFGRTIAGAKKSFDFSGKNVVTKYHSPAIRVNYKSRGAGMLKFLSPSADIVCEEEMCLSRPLFTVASTERVVMEIGASAAILDALSQGTVGLTEGIASLSQQQAAENTELLVQMYALKLSMDFQESAALRLIQEAMGLGQNIDITA